MNPSVVLTANHPKNSSHRIPKASDAAGELERAIWWSRIVHEINTQQCTETPEQSLLELESKLDPVQLRPLANNTGLTKAAVS